MCPPNPSGVCQCGCGKLTRLAPRTDRQLGWIKGAPIRFIAGHSRRKMIAFEDGRDYRRQDFGYATPCWLWLGARSGAYGCLWRNVGGKRAAALAHRLSYEHHIGPIPAGLVIDDLCGIQICVNPEHLEAVSSGENTRRAAAKRAASRTPAKRLRSRRGRGARYAEDELPYEVTDAGYITSCWIWTRAVTRYGYPEMIITRALKTRRRQLYAHRVYWARKNGPIPRGHELDHLCGNARCVNPDHLEAVPIDVHRARTAKRPRSQRPR
jgi:hypothetical protein